MEDHRAERAADQIFRGAAQHPSRRGVDERRPALQVHADDPFSRGVEDDLGQRAGGLGHPPRRQRDGAHGQDEGAVDPGPQPGMRPRGPVVVHGLRIEDADHAVVHDDVPDGEDEGRPVLIEGQQPDHHEEMEVELDVAAGEVHEERRRRHQAEAGDHAAQSAWTRQNARQHGRDADRARLQEDVRHLELPHGGEDGDADRVHPEQDEDAAVAAGPDALGQAPALGHETAKTRTNPTKRGRRRDEIHHAGYRSRHRASGPGSLSREQGRDFLSKVSAIIPASGPDAAIAFDDDRRGNT